MQECAVIFKMNIMQFFWRNNMHNIHAQSSAGGITGDAKRIYGRRTGPLNRYRKVIPNGQKFLKPGSKMPTNLCFFCLLFRVSVYIYFQQLFRTGD